MNPEPIDILKKVKRLEIKTRRLVNEVFSGEYHSVFKGQGIEFSEVREYIPGDDIRSIDWNVTARMGHPYVKKFMEERQLNVLLMVDLSGSQNFGSGDRLKSEVAAELAALIAFSAIRNNDRVGLLIFTDQIEKYLPPKRNKRYGMRMIREILFYKPKGKKTNIAKALEYVAKVLPKRSVVFLISDYLDTSFEKPLRITAKKHDLIALELFDQHEEKIPSIGLLRLEDRETDQMCLVNTDSKAVSLLIEDEKKKRSQSLKKLFQSNRVDHARIETQTSYAKSLNQLFKMRERRAR
ncbi:MAG: DUF58 domain-containing protein [Chlamydiae bacterium]|nr:DUF58 domain-containing protein [Chlamydiota bacterium]MBI3277460.1 DUF58 domain-containing protein [Chlamydiota bacterium]